MNADYEVVEYDHKRWRAAAYRAMQKFPEHERYDRLLGGVESMLRRALNHGSDHAIIYQTECLNALKKDTELARELAKDFHY